MKTRVNSISLPSYNFRVYVVFSIPNKSLNTGKIISLNNTSKNYVNYYVNIIVPAIIAILNFSFISIIFFLVDGFVKK